MSFIFKALTRRPSTIKSYMERTEALKNQVRATYNLDASTNVDPRLLVGWLSERKPSYSSATWRQYKSACLCSLENELDLLDERDDPTPWIDSIETLKQIDSDGTGAKSEKTSSKKLKRFSNQDFEKLELYLNSKPHEMHKALIKWLKSGIWTGLRPSEWANAEWININGTPALLVQNAKHSNGRAHGKTRTVIMHRMSKDEQEIVKEHLDLVHRWSSSGNFDRKYHSCAQKLYLAARKLWPKRSKHITLYSTRHQFVADAKASNLNLSEIAALMGHAVDDTATSHYGKRTAGQQILKVQALAEDVARINNVFKGHPDRRIHNDPPSIKSNGIDNRIGLPKIPEQNSKNLNG